MAKRNAHQLSDTGGSTRRASWALQALAGICFALASPVTGATLLNGDFSSGFDHWLGEVTDINFNTDFDISPLPGAYTNNFSTDSNGALLSTSTLIDDIFSVFIYQLFVVDVAAPGEKLILSYELTPVLTDPGFGDTAFAQIASGPGFGDILDLTGSSLDITPLSGQTALILFGVEDFDDSADSLRVANVAIRHESTKVPEPSMALLLLPGLLVLTRRTRRSRKR